MLVDLASQIRDLRRVAQELKELPEDTAQPTDVYVRAYVPESRFLDQRRQTDEQMLALQFALRAMRG